MFTPSTFKQPFLWGLVFLSSCASELFSKKKFWGSPEAIWIDYFDAEMFHNGESVATEGFITEVLSDRTMDFKRIELPRVDHSNG